MRRTRAAYRLAAAILATLIAQPAPGDTGDEIILERVVEDARGGNLYRAASGARCLLRDYPGSTHRKEAWLLLISSCLRSGRTGRGIEHLRQYLLEFSGEGAPVSPELRELLESEPQLLRILSERMPEFRFDPSPLKPVLRLDDLLAPPAVPLKAPVETAVQEAPVEMQERVQPTVVRAYFAVSTCSPFKGRKVTALLNRLAKHRLQPVAVSAAQRATVTRLLVGRYRSRSEAERRLAAMGSASRGMFIVERGDGYHLFAGSYLSPRNAQQEKGRLARRGIRVSLVKAEVPMQIWEVTMGMYNTEKEAAGAARRLTAAGVEAKVVRVEEREASPSVHQEEPVPAIFIHDAHKGVQTVPVLR